ncbi:MAG TPA: RNA pseudouridine synthase [Clostridiales bacterium]|nr:RNA pseudouridine synthase [Clostridiales bacterium]
MKKKITVTTKADEKFRADVFLAENTDLTRSRLKKLFNDGLVTVNGCAVKSGAVVKCGDEIEFNIPDLAPAEAKAEDIPLEVVYEDADVAVINKPQGMTVHAGNGVSDGTLVNALLYRIKDLSGVGGVLRPGIVHRIDKNTSGLLVVAKNDKAHVNLAKQIENKTCHRVYVALLEGNLKTDCGRIETFIGRDKKDRTKMAVTAFGRKAITDYKVLCRYDGYTFTEFTLQTGRTHQIRVHAKYLGHPVVGDPEYGYKNQKFKLNGQLLHAKTLEFTHPSTGEKMSFTVPLPQYFTAVLNKLKKI